MADKDGKSASGDEKRNYFRIDDVIPVVASPVHLDNIENEEVLKKITSSKALSMIDPHGTPSDEDETATTTHLDSSANNELYDMVKEIKTKLDYIINHFILEKEGLSEPEKKLVNISASGIRFTVSHPVKEGDIMEIKLVLPTYPPVAVFAYGKVIRAMAMEDGNYEVALEYLNMSESVRSEIIQYTLSHQRESIKKMKEPGKEV